MTDCIFCKIVKGEIPSSKVYETKNTLAIMDIQPVNKGHVLIIPKIHYETLLDLPDNILTEISILVKRVSAAVKHGVKAPGFNIMMNNYPVAGQVVPHAHIHIVPRFLNDGLRLWPGGSYKEGEQEQIKEKIASFLVSKGNNSP